MTRLELLASQLDCEAFPHEVKGVEQIFSRNIRFWELCLKCEEVLKNRKQLEKLSTGIKMVTPKLQPAQPSGGSITVDAAQGMQRGVVNNTQKI